MNTTDLFTTALGLSDPWYVTKVEFKGAQELSDTMELHIYVNFRRGATFHMINSNGESVCDKSGNPIEYKAHDTVERTWQHLDFFQFHTYLHARVPKISNGEGNCQTVIVPWARKHSGFTLLFEALVLELAKDMPILSIARRLGVNDKRIWNVINHYVDEMRKDVDMSQITSLGMDETSRKGHNYITVVMDLEKHTVLYVTEGKDSTTVDAFTEDFCEHKGKADKIKIVSCDMSLGFKKGIEQNFPNSQLVIDKFHVIKHCNEAVDSVRKQETKENSELKGTKYIWLKNEGSLTEKQRAKRDRLSKRHLKVSRAYSMKTELQNIYETCNDYQSAESRLKKLCSWMMHSQLEPMKDFCRLIKRHWETILNYFKERYTNAILEGTNSIIQGIKVRARGFRNIEYFKNLIYLRCGGLNIDGAIQRLYHPVYA